MISVIVPTFNEEKNICDLIKHIKSCDRGEEVEIIVCDAPISQDEGFTQAVKMGVKAVKSPRAFRAFQMNFGVQHASHDVLYFLHADARPPYDFVERITSALAEHDLGIFAYKFDSSSAILKVNAYFTQYDGLFAGGGDQSLFIKKSAFQRLGGYNEKLRIMEDFDFYKRAKKAGFKKTIVKEPLVVSARKYEHNSWFKVNYINLSIFMLYWLNGSQDRMIKLNQRLS